MQGIEDMKELFLGFLFSAKKLNVIHNEHIDIFVENRKLTCAVVPDRLNKLISKALRGDVENSQFVLKLLLYPISDTLDQVCFSQACSTIYKKGIKRVVPRVICDSHRSGTCQSVAIPFYVPLKNVIGVEIRVYIRLSNSRNDKRMFNFARMVLCKRIHLLSFMWRSEERRVGKVVRGWFTLSLDA